MLFKIKVGTPGPLSLDLENGGCITLRPGIAFDIEQVCSREWIDKDPNFQTQIKRGMVVVVFDSTKTDVPHHDFSRHPRLPARPIPPESPETPPVPVPEVIVSKQKPSSIIASEGVPEVMVLEPQPDDNKADRVVIPIPNGPILDLDMLQALDLGQIREIAHKLGLPTQYRSKANLIKAILRRNADA